ncbi:MAG: hypothetical protein MJZ11_02475 [Lachnospiraceae bacterium]|nr:hypothetical protein [Lachnospiraceae bacterium]
MKKHFYLIILSVILIISGCNSNKSIDISEPAALDEPEYETEAMTETKDEYDAESDAQHSEATDDFTNSNSTYDNITYRGFNFKEYLNAYSPIEKEYEDYNSAIYSIVNCNDDALFLVVNGYIDDNNRYEAIYIYNGFDTKKFYVDDKNDDSDSETYGSILINEDTSNIIITKTDFTNEVNTLDFYKYDNKDFLHICTVTKNFASHDYKIESEDGIIDDSEALSEFEKKLFDDFGKFIFDDFDFSLNDNYDEISKYEGFHTTVEDALVGYFRL